MVGYLGSYSREGGQATGAEEANIYQSGEISW